MLKFKNKIIKLSRSEHHIKLICFAVMLIYIYCVLNLTLLARTSGVRRIVLTPFWELRSMLESGNYSHWVAQILGNVFMLVPLGSMLPILNEKFRSVKNTAIAGLLFSMFIEFTQYYTGRGLFEVDDILHNTLGAVTGYFFYIIFSRIIAYKEMQE